jgi:hypothetical protein
MARDLLTWVGVAALLLGGGVAASLINGSPQAYGENRFKFDHSHLTFAKVLSEFVEDGWVDYTGLRQRPSNLEAYLDQLAAVSKKGFKKWSEDEQIAFYINLYNAATLKLIIDHYPLKSIRSIGNVIKGPWDQSVVRLFGETVTLNHVEHEILRKQYTEPRIHFALVCAAKSCPHLREEPYIPYRLEEQLEDQGKRFLNTPSKNYVDLESRTAYLSEIFKWFKGDFENENRSVLAFVRGYFPVPISSEMGKNKFRIRHLKYDWSLNDTKSRPS